MALHQNDDSLSTSLTLFKSHYSCDIDCTFVNQILKHAFFYTQDMDYCYQVCRYYALSAHTFCNCTLTSVNEKCLACKFQQSIASSEAKILRLFGGMSLCLRMTYHFYCSISSGSHTSTIIQLFLHRTLLHSVSPLASVLQTPMLYRQMIFFLYLHERNRHGSIDSSKQREEGFQGNTCPCSLVSILLHVGQPL